MKKYLLPSALILVLGLGLALAQTINKSVQLSQDNTGPIGVDTNFGVYFPGHLLSTGAGQPAPSITGTGTPTIAGTDFAGLITMGNAATTATALFGRAYISTASCVLSTQSQTGPTPITYTSSVTGFSITQAGATANKINYFCSSVS